MGYLKVGAKISTASPSIISYAGEQGVDSGLKIAGCLLQDVMNIFSCALSLPGKGDVRRIGAIFRCDGFPRLAAEGLLLFCLIKKVTKKSRLGSDVGLARRNLNGGSARARFNYNKDLFLGAVRATLGLGYLKRKCKNFNGFSFHHLLCRMSRMQIAGWK
ncbi:hypothetical protein [Pedobacter sp. N23S346]|uniref:hypothetical protein n=1 Tax=Pedobacter sp. N23S346 TaxID=3402750 RepID=UPI003AC964D0